MSLSLFKSEYVDYLKKRVKTDDIDAGYFGRGIKYGQSNVIRNPYLESPDETGLKLMMPGESETFEYENAKILFKHFRGMNITQATDERIWTYLTHVSFWDYMKKRRPIEDSPESQRQRYILRHYFVDPVNARNLLLNDISLLWWGVYLTYDADNKQDPFWLTAEAFSMLDYTRHLLPGSQGRSRTFALAVLQYVKENPKLFKGYKEAKVRFVMRKCNFVSGYKLLPILSRAEIIDTISKYKNEIAGVKEENEKAERDSELVAADGKKD